MSEGATDRDGLISRIIDGEASAEDWRTFRSLAEQDPRLWTEFAETHATHEALERAVEGAIGVADGVEIEIPPTPEEVFAGRLRLVRVWSGWAAAALVALAWFVGFGGEDVVEGPVTAGVVPGLRLSEAGPDEALRRYLAAGQEAGRVVGEMPQRIVLETRPTDDGSRVEVLYVRQIVERAVLDEVYRLSEDELGNAVRVREPVRLAPGSAF